MSKPRDRDTLELERTTSRALQPGVFVGYRHMAAFVGDLEEVRQSIASLVDDGEPTRAVELLETMIGACYEKSEEIDDSGGDFGMFVAGLFCDWIRARQATGAEPDDTAETLLSWMESDDYGYCNRLEGEAVKVLDRRGLAAFQRAVQNRFEGREEGSYESRRMTEILKTIQVKRRNVDGYVALCGGAPDPRDCEVVAEICLKRRRTEEALAWAERGLELAKKRPHSAWGLPDLKRKILTKLGRTKEALDSAWEHYRKAPSVYSYKDLMSLAPSEERADWHAKALVVLDEAPLFARIEVLRKTNELERLAALVDGASRRALMSLSHYATEPAADALLKKHPLVSAKLDAVLGLRILEAKKAKYYGAALEHFQRARETLVEADQEDTWRKLVAEVRKAHHRKHGFMPGFERLAMGGTLTPEPSLLDRARSRWITRCRSVR
jgi:hypothetical protein